MQIMSGALAKRAVFKINLLELVKIVYLSCAFSFRILSSLFSLVSALSCSNDQTCLENGPFQEAPGVWAYAYVYNFGWLRPLSWWAGLGPTFEENLSFIVEAAPKSHPPRRWELFMFWPFLIFCFSVVFPLDSSSPKQSTKWGYRLDGYVCL